MIHLRTTELECEFESADAEDVGEDSLDYLQAATDRA